MTENHIQTKDLCGCSVCGITLTTDDKPVQNPVYKAGELSHIELAHRTCMPEWSVNDDWNGSADN